MKRTKEEIFKEWKLIEEFLGAKYVEEDGYFFIKDEYNKHELAIGDTEGEVWKDAQEYHWNYFEDWSTLMPLVAKINEIATKESKYQGLVIFNNRVYLNSRLVCKSIHLNSNNPKIKITYDTLLECTYQACLLFINKYNENEKI